METVETQGLRVAELLNSPQFRAAKAELQKVIANHQKKLNGIQPPKDDSAIKERFLETLALFQKNRGRELYFPYLSSGLGNGPFVELLDGSVKYDLISGIGFNLFGHSHPELQSEVIDSLPSDVMQGNLQSGIEAAALMKRLVQLAGRNSKLQMGWFATCGTMANEIALKIIRQKHAPATRIFAFRDCFAGRSTAMQEITDNPKYREGQPIYGEVHYLSFYDPNLGLEKSLSRVCAEMDDVLIRYPGKLAGMMIEIVQGEGGFNFAPRSWYVGLFEHAKKHDLAIWCDEIQTFGRTGELFAFEKFNLGQWVDVVTVAKALQASAVLFRAEYNPRAGLIAGTFTGSVSALRSGRKILDMLAEPGVLGPEGIIQKRSDYFHSQLEGIKKRKGENSLAEVRSIGAMIAFRPYDGSMENVKNILMKLYDRGVVAFYCGHDPYLIRMLPPLVIMTEKQIDEVCSIIESSL